jgi:hypothetical protein
MLPYVCEHCGFCDELDFILGHGLQRFALDTRKDIQRTLHTHSHAAVHDQEGTGRLGWGSFPQMRFEYLKVPTQTHG